MDPIELVYDNMDAVPEAVRGLYTEGADGKVILTGVNGIKTQADIDRLSGALSKERSDHGAAKTALKPWTDLGMSAEDVSTQLARIPELETAASGKIDETKINEMVDGRLAAKTKPLELQITTLTGERDTLKEENTQLRGQIVGKERNDLITQIGTQMKINPPAMEDAQLYLQSIVVKDPDTGKFVGREDHPEFAGIEVAQIMAHLQKGAKAHWWPESQGGGSGGGRGVAMLGGEPNPWAHDTWNMTKQGEIFNRLGAAKAEELAKLAGTTLGGPRPAAKK